MDLEFIQTGDNSPTLYHPELNEHYHSTHGAYQESVHVYIKSGLDLFKDKKQISIFEMGFGTGLNVLLAWIFAQENKIQIDLTSIELFPLPKTIWSNLDYYQNEVEKNVFDEMHSRTWEKTHEVSPNFNLTKFKESLLEFNTIKKFDVIFFDAFGPDKQPDLWEIPVFEKLFAMLNPNGILVTYSAKGQVRRNMQAVGFRVERIPGPPGKREMLRARRD